MANKEIRIPFEKIKDPQTITDVQEREFRAHGLSTHLNEVDKLEDDHKTKTRIISIRDKKLFVVPDLPWLHKKNTKGGDTDER